MGRARAHDAGRLRLAVLAGAQLIRDQLADAWSHTVAGKRGDVHEDLRVPTGRFDEAESAIVIPFGQGAMGAHGSVLNSVYEVGYVPQNGGSKRGRCLPCGTRPGRQDQ